MVWPAASAPGRFSDCLAVLWWVRSYQSEPLHCRAYLHVVDVDPSLELELPLLDQGTGVDAQQLATLAYLARREQRAIGIDPHNGILIERKRRLWIVGIAHRI